MSSTGCSTCERSPEVDGAVQSVPAAGSRPASAQPVIFKHEFFFLHLSPHFQGVVANPFLPAGAPVSF